MAVNGNDTSTWDLARVKRVLIGRNGSTCVLTVRQKGTHNAIDVTLMRGCLEWWELHDRVSLTEQQLSESEKSAQEFRQMWMVESKRATSESTQREELSIELEGYRAALASTRNALRVADDELAKEYAKTSELKIELSRVKSSLEAQLKEQQDFMERAKEAMAACSKAEGERDEAEKEIRKLRQEIEDLKRQASGAEEERDLSHRMYREVDFARKTAMQRLADAQAQLALLTSDNEALKKDVVGLQQDKDREIGLKLQSDQELDVTRRSSNAIEKELKDLQPVKDRLSEEKQALSNEVVRLQTMLADKEKQVQATLQKLAQQQSSLSDALALNSELEALKAQMSREVEAMRRRAEAAETAAMSADAKLDATLQRIPPLEKAAAENAVLQEQLESSLGKLRETQNELGVLQAKLAQSAASEAAKETRIKSTDLKMGQDSNDMQALKQAHEQLTLKFRELETAHKGCQAVKDLLVDYRGTIEDLQDGIKSRDSEILRLNGAQTEMVRERDQCRKDMEEQRLKFEERIRLMQSEITEKILASQEFLENEQKKFDAKLLEMSEKNQQQKAQSEKEKLDFENKLKAKDLEIQEDLAELEALKHEVDKRVEKERVSLQKQFKEQTDDLQEQLKKLQQLKDSADKQHAAEMARFKADLNDRIEQFTRDQDDLNSQWRTRFEDLTKSQDEEKARLAAANARKVESLLDDVKQAQDERDKILASIPDKVQKECDILNQEIKRLQIELDAMEGVMASREAAATKKTKYEAEAQIADLRGEIAQLQAMLEAEKSKLNSLVHAETAKLNQENAKVVHDLQAQLDKANSDNDRLTLEIQRLKQELQKAEEWREKYNLLVPEIKRHQAELDALSKTVESRIASERQTVSSEWQLKIEELKRDHNAAIGKVKLECKDKVNDEHRKCDETVAKISIELKDQLSKEKVKWMEQHGAMERELREKCASYKEERDHVKMELDRFSQCVYFTVHVARAIYSYDLRCVFVHGGGVVQVMRVRVYRC